MSHPDLSASRPVADFLSRTGLAPRQAHKLLDIWPLVAEASEPAPLAPAYVTLADAAAAGALRVDEVGGGSVPHVAVENRGDVAVLVLFGEEIHGALQNRVVNASFLVPAEDTLRIDVSCVEQGRWSRSQGARFRATSEILASSMRRRMERKVSESRSLSGHFAADQGDVWSEVSDRLEHARADSPTDSYHAYRESRRVDLEEVSRAFQPLEGQVGFVAAIGDEVVGAEMVGRPEVFARAFQGLLRAYVIDAIDAAFVRARQEAPVGAPAPRFDSPESFLAVLSSAPAQLGPSLGLGDDLRIEGEGVAGCALVAGDVVHLTAFPAEGA